MKQCQEELLRKKSLIIRNLQSTRISILDAIKTDPRLWDEKCFNFDFKSKANLLLEADISIQELTKKLEEIKEEAKRKANEERMTKHMDIFVKINGHKTITLEVQLSNTIWDLKAKIKDKIGIQPDQHTLFFNGKYLRDEITLDDYKRNGVFLRARTIELVRRSTIWNKNVQYNNLLTILLDRARKNMPTRIEKCYLLTLFFPFESACYF